VLFYGTGGLALTDIKVASSYADNFLIGGVTGDGSSSTVKAGFAVGGGAEWAVSNNWSIKAEYLYVKFGSVAAASAISGVTVAGYAQAVSTAVDLTAHVARIGANYKF
jgi:outer membrane immunogenic protein